MLLKKINLKGGKLIFTGISPRLSMLFRLYGIDPSLFSGDELGILASRRGAKNTAPARRQRKRATYKIAETGARQPGCGRVHS